MADRLIFLFGPLADRPLLQSVLGSLEGVALRAALSPGHKLVTDASNPLPCLKKLEAGAADYVDGVVVSGLDAEPFARLSFFAASLRMAPVEVPVTLDRGARGTLASFARMAIGDDAKPFDINGFAADLLPTYRAAAVEIMTYFGAKTALDVSGMLPTILMRAGSHVRAEHAAPTDLRSDKTAGGDVVIKAARTPYVNYFKVGELDLSFRRFDGAMSEVVTRAGFEAADAVTVLPYDAAADTVLLVEQFRMGPLLRGDPKPWMLEPIAGRIDPGESPQSTARREAVEEAGLTLTHLEQVAAGYPSPGAYTEFLYSFVALTSLEGQGGGTFGLHSEAEDIRTHVVPFARLLDLVQSGEITCGPLLMTVFWLSLNRDRLRALA